MGRLPRGKWSLHIVYNIGSSRDPRTEPNRRGRGATTVTEKKVSLGYGRNRLYESLEVLYYRWEMMFPSIYPSIRYAALLRHCATPPFTPPCESTLPFPADRWEGKQNEKRRHGRTSGCFLILPCYLYWLENETFSSFFSRLFLSLLFFLLALILFYMAVSSDGSELAAGPIYIYIYIPKLYIYWLCYFLLLFYDWTLSCAFAEFQRMRVTAFPVWYQMDLRHINSSDNLVEIGINLKDYYPSVEWDIISVPAERHQRYYECCPNEFYPGKHYTTQRPWRT